MDSESSPDYKALFLREAERRKEAEERTRQTTFLELLRHCHTYFSLPLRAEAPSRSTTGKIPPPTGKCCPLRLLPWEDCVARQQEIYRSVRTYLEPPGEAAAQRFSPRLALEDLGQRFSERPISSEQDLESYERFGVENYVRDIIVQLCQIPAARDEFNLGDGVRFENHTNALNEASHPQINEPSSSRRSKPDQFCIHRVDGDNNTLLLTVEYKPPHKLSVENLRAGLQPMNFWEDIVQSNSVPTEEPTKLEYNAAWLTGSAVTQEYHVMIQEGLEYSYLTNGLALILLYIPYNDPSTLYYHLCEPNMEVDLDNDSSFEQPLTTIARVLCLCLMSFGTRLRDQIWRNNAREQLPVWTTSFDHTRSQIPERELQQNPPGSEHSSPSASSRLAGSDYVTSSSSPVKSPTAEHRMPTRSRARCTPDTLPYRDDSPDSDLDSAPGGRKRGFSQVTLSPSSPSAQRSARRTGYRYDESGGHQHTAQFCTQRCLLGLQQGSELDNNCPNIMLHRQGGTSSRHLIDAKTLVQWIKQQLDENLDRNCTPMGGCGASGAPFKITCIVYGYTVVGKGTTSGLWNEVKHEAVIYRILSRAQGSAVPVFLGTIDLAKIYFLHGAGEIRHMLLMAWGGEPINNITHNDIVRQEISRSKKLIRSLGVKHGDLRLENILWNAELNRALIIDFHCSQLDPQAKKRPRWSGGLDLNVEAHERKRHRIL